MYKCINNCQNDQARSIYTYTTLEVECIFISMTNTKFDTKFIGNHMLPKCACAGILTSILLSKKGLQCRDFSCAEKFHGGSLMPRQYY